MDLEKNSDPMVMTNNSPTSEAVPPDQTKQQPSDNSGGAEATPAASNQPRSDQERVKKYYEVVSRMKFMSSDQLSHFLKQERDNLPEEIASLIEYELVAKISGESAAEIGNRQSNIQEMQKSTNMKFTVILVVFILITAGLLAWQKQMMRERDAGELAKPMNTMLQKLLPKAKDEGSDSTNPTKKGSQYLPSDQEIKRIQELCGCEPIDNPNCPPPNASVACKKAYYSH
jgi:hypothetical protein